LPFRFFLKEFICTVKVFLSLKKIGFIWN